MALQKITILTSSSEKPVSALSFVCGFSKMTVVEVNRTCLSHSAFVDILSYWMCGQDLGSRSSRSRRPKRKTKALKSVTREPRQLRWENVLSLLERKIGGEEGNLVVVQKGFSVVAADRGLLFTTSRERGTNININDFCLQNFPLIIPESSTYSFQHGDYARTVSINERNAAIALC